MFRWITSKLQKPKEFKKSILGVEVTVSKVESQWFAMFRAWDLGYRNTMGESVPERCDICGVDPSDVLKQARDYIAMLKPN